MLAARQIQKVMQKHRPLGIIEALFQKKQI